MKERYLDAVINDEARRGHPSTRGCEVRKLDAEHCQASRKKRSPQKRQSRGGRRRNRKTVPSVSVVVYVNRNERSDGTLPSSGRRDERVIAESLSTGRFSLSAVVSSPNNGNSSIASRHSSGNEKFSFAVSRITN